MAVGALVLYLATAPKSNAAYVAFKAAMKAAKDTGSLMPPKNILNAPTGLMKDIGYGDEYIYDHDTPEGFSGQNCFLMKCLGSNFIILLNAGLNEILKNV